MMGPLLDQGFDDLLLIGSEHTEYGNSGTKNIKQSFYSHMNKGVVHTNFSQFCCCIG